MSVADDRKPTQFGHAMKELGITQVFAHSPEAKGQVERTNGTFQDRLVSELRLAGASTINEANIILTSQMVKMTHVRNFFLNLRSLLVLKAIS